VTPASPVVVTEIRSRINERGDFLMTTTPPHIDGAVSSGSEVVLTDFMSGGGYTTQPILFGQSDGGTLLLYSGDGSAP
jgi:hypothetical protein